MKENGEIEEITTKEGIERACMKENETKYQQTKGTPCMIEPLRSLLNFDAETQTGKEILEGKFITPEDTPLYTQEFFDQMKKPEGNLDFKETYILQDDFREGWKKMKEKTSAGISGMHFGHMKACATNELLTEFESSMSNIPFATGHIPPKWKVGVSVMIHKKAMVDLVTKLRTVTLLEADFNFNNKILGKRTMEHAERNNLIAKEQYGSRPGKNSIKHAIHKRMTYDILRQLRIPGALCSNDAKSCFDRMVHAIVSLAYQCLGVPNPPIQCMLRSIQ